MMGFFDLKAICAICDEETGLNRYRIANKKWICPSCFKEAGFKKLAPNEKPLQKMTVEDIHAAMSKKKENDDELSSFNPTKKISTFVEFDDTKKKWLILSSVLGRRDKSKVYNYSDIVDFELLEDGESVTQGGLGRALVGGALFGRAGAVVGGVTGKRKNKEICNSLKIKITLSDIKSPVVYINFLNSPTKKNSFIFKTLYNEAQECLSVLQLICNEREDSVNSHKGIAGLSDADELLKFKELLDAGVITQEDFDKKKKEILG